MALCLSASLGSGAAAQTATPEFARRSDVIYGRKFGMALTMEVFAPAARNGIGVVWVVSSSGRSSRKQTLQESFEKRIAPLLDRGYAVFAAILGSAPIFNVQDQVSDVRRAVRYVRHHAAEFGIDGHRLGLSGSSAGGYLPWWSRWAARTGIRPPARLIVRKGVGHAYPGWEADAVLIAEWFDEHLRRMR